MPRTREAKRTGGALRGAPTGNPLTGVFRALFRAELDFRVKLFNVFALGGIGISASMALYSALAVGGLVQAALNALAGALAVVLTWTINKKGCYQTGYLITILLVFFLLFPVLFFTGGGYRGGMPCFFVFAVIFTVLMLEGRRRYALALGEILLYALCVLAAYRWPGLVTPLPDEGSVITDVIIGVAVVSLLLGAVLSVLMRMYNSQQKKLDRQNDVLAQVSHAKTEFLANASHEMRTPLTVVSVDIQSAEGLLRRESDSPDPELLALLSDAQAEIMRLANMVDGMLKLNAISEHTEKSRLDLTALLNGTADMLRLTLAGRENELRADVAQGLTIFANADLIAQVVIDLLQNANAHTSRDAIALSARQTGGEIAVAVEDHGAGISAALLPHVFERGVTQGGTGLGLYICRTVVESHGGSIRIASREGAGTTVAFTLPVYQGQLGGGL